jgi:NAD(P)-dependent dehydrogenase (short-subunit alcohol dehydrogenase family)
MPWGVITGGASGIGAGLVKLFMNTPDLRILIIDSNQSAYDDFLRDNNIRCADFERLRFVNVDLTKTDLVLDLVESSSFEGSASFLINNASFKDRGNPGTDHKKSNWMRSLDVGVLAPYFLSTHFMQKAGENRLSIVNISSVCTGHVTLAEPAYYHATKAALEALTRYLAACAPPNVSINALQLGFIVQERHRKRYFAADNVAFREIVSSCLNDRDVGREEDIFQLINFLIFGETTFLNGQTITFDGGVTNLCQFDKMLSGFSAK